MSKISKTKAKELAALRDELMTRIVTTVAKANQYEGSRQLFTSLGMELNQNLQGIVDFSKQIVEKIDAVLPDDLKSPQTPIEVPDEAVKETPKKTTKEKKKT